MSTGSNRVAQLTTASVHWHEGQPQSTLFGDVYYSRDNGYAESNHVFIDGNDLRTRWAALPPQSVFTIMETGFGTGLNFLVAVELWLAMSPPGSYLNFVSVEKFPLRREDMAQALSAWPQLATVKDQLLEHYPAPVPGFHRLWLFDNRVCLTLILDDGIKALEDLATSDHPLFDRGHHPLADAWFLDGFAPAKNPDLWCQPLFDLMARLSKPGTTASTFTVVKPVREGLKQAGFSVRKTPGHGRKWSMLRASFNAPEDSAGHIPAENNHRRNAAFAPPWYLSPFHKCEKRALVIGGGIAGCTSAAALVKRGWQVTIIERHPQLAAEASGNPQGILYPRLSVEDLALSVFARQALCHAIHYYQPLWQQEGLGKQCGVLVLPESDRDRQHFPLIAKRYQQATKLVTALHGKQLEDAAGVGLDHTIGLFFPRLGWVVPPAVCAALAAGCEVIEAEVTRLHFDPSHQQWQVFSGDSVTATAPVVILASGHGVTQFEQTAHLPVRQIRGQISAVAANAASARLQTVICGAGYLAPACNGEHTLGATYDLDDTETTVRAVDHQRNLATLSATDPALGRLFDAEESPLSISGRAGLRCTTPDYLPIAGPAPNLDGYIVCYSDLRRNARADIPRPGPCWPGLWLNCGHGSRGFTYAPLAAELIASQISGDPLPLPRQLAMALHPGRFIIRDLKRNRL